MDLIASASPPRPSPDGQDAIPVSEQPRSDPAPTRTYGRAKGTCCGYWNRRLRGRAAKFPQRPQLVFQPRFPENTHLAGGPRSLPRGCPSSVPRTRQYPEDAGRTADGESGCSASERSAEDAPGCVCPVETQEVPYPWGQGQHRVLTCCYTDLACFSTRGVWQR